MLFKKISLKRNLSTSKSSTVETRWGSQYVVGSIVLVLTGLGFFSGCESNQRPAATAPSPRSSPLQSLKATPTTSAFEVELTKPVRAPVEVTLSGPRDVRATVKKGEPLLKSFELEAGQWELLVRSEGHQNLKVPITIPGTEHIAVALMEIPHYWDKKQATEQRQLKQAKALKAKQAREAELRRKQKVAEDLARKEKQRALAQAEVEASESETPSAKEFAAGIIQTKGMIEAEMATMEMPVDADPVELLGRLAEGLGEDATAGHFVGYMSHLRNVTASNDDEIVKLIFITRDLVRKTSTEQPTLLEVASGLCDATPSKGGRGQDLRAIAATIVLGMAYLNQN